MKIESIGGIPVTAERPFLVAEAGVNHEGSMEKAFEMIDAAANAGADMIKFQSYKAETLASKDSPAYWDRTKEAADSQYTLFKRYDSFDVDDYRKLKARCDEKGILFGSTPFDLYFADALDDLLSAHKIASADITNTFLLKKIAAKGKPVMISTGASHLGEIEQALRILEENGAPSVALLHCILQYPTPPEHSNLRSIPYLARTFPDVSIGWSDHVPPVDGCLAMLTAWLLGATVLEKHYTLDKSLPGNDHYHAMDPDDIKLFRSQQQQMASMLGQEAKTCFPFEQEARKQARRSLVAAVNIAKGAVIGPDMLIAKRPGTGISPLHAELIVGRAAPRDIAADEVLKWDTFLAKP